MMGSSRAFFRRRAMRPPMAAPTASSAAAAQIPATSSPFRLFSGQFFLFFLHLIRFPPCGMFVFFLKIKRIQKQGAEQGVRAPQSQLEAGQQTHDPHRRHRLKQSRQARGHLNQA